MPGQAMSPSEAGIALCLTPAHPACSVPPLPTLSPLQIETTFKRNGAPVTPGDLPTKQQEAVDKLNTALKGNPMFYKTVEIPPKDQIPATYFFLFQPRVIQW